VRVVGIGQDLLDYDEARELEKVGRELARGSGGDAVHQAAPPQAS
jgi:hypothetical protein